MKRSDLESLSAAFEAEARREIFPLDRDIYEEAGRSPSRPILYAGSLTAPVAFFGRDLGRDEVLAAEPLIGAAGRQVRRGVAIARGWGPDPTDEDLRAASELVLLTNTVPYKPPGNKAYGEGVKRRFRPLISAFLTFFWEGDRVITLGNEALKWFRPYSDAGAFSSLFEDPDRRYVEELPIEIEAEWEGKKASRTLRLAPLPHPSPLNVRWYKRFPDLLQGRLGSLFES